MGVDARHPSRAGPRPRLTGIKLPPSARRGVSTSTTSSADASQRYVAADRAIVDRALATLTIEPSRRRSRASGRGLPLLRDERVALASSTIVSQNPPRADYALERLARRWRAVIGVLVAAAAVAAGVHLVLQRPHTGAERIRHLIAWPDDCAAITVDRPLGGDGSEWRHTVDAALIQCQMLGPFVIYARFASARERDRQLGLFPPPDEAYCTTGTEVILDGLEHGFATLCQRLHGRLHPAPRSFAERLPPDQGPYRFARRPITWLATRHLTYEGAYTVGVIVRLNRALPARTGAPDAEIRIDGGRTTGPMTTLSQSAHCYQQRVAPRGDRVHPPVSGTRLSVELIVDGEPRGVFTRIAPLRAKRPSARTVAELGC